MTYIIIEVRESFLQWQRGGIGTGFVIPYPSSNKQSSYTSPYPNTTSIKLLSHSHPRQISSTYLYSYPYTLYIKYYQIFNIKRKVFLFLQYQIF